MKTPNRIAFLSLVVFWLATVTTARALPWMPLVETLATRAESIEAREAGGKVLFRNADAAAEFLASVPTRTSNEGAWAARFDRLRGADDTLREQWRALAPADRQLALELAEGAQRVLARHPGEPAERLLQNLDVDGLALARAYGDHVVDGMEWIESAETLEALGKDASQAAAGWKSVVRKTGVGGGAFWREYVAPHKAKWLAAGALAAYLAAPESFHDEAGRLTAHGAEVVGRLLGDAALGAGNGLLTGIGASIRKHFDAAPVPTTLTLAIIAGLLFVALPFGQALLGRFFLRALRRRPTAPRRRGPQRE